MKTTEIDFISKNKTRNERFKKSIWTFVQPENRNRIQKSETRNRYQNSESIVIWKIENFRNQKTKNVFELKNLKLTYLKNDDFENSETISKMMTHKIFWNQKPKTDCPKNLKTKSDFLKNEIRKTNLSETKIWKPTFEIRIWKLIKIQNFLETKNRKTIFEIRFSKLQNKIRKRIAKFYETKNRK